MAQFDVWKNTTGSAATLPYFVEVQSDFLDDLASRVVIPMVSAADGRSAKYLNPEIEVGGAPYFLVTQELAPIPTRVLSGRPVVNLAPHRDTIIRAIDFLISGH